jgi:serine/threonine protein phosphatase 1
MMDLIKGARLGAKSFGGRQKTIMSYQGEAFLDEAALHAIEAFSPLFDKGDDGRNVMTTYAIGDIHGRADLLIALLDAIRTAHPPQRNCKLIFLGDLVDRGPHSARAVAIVRALQESTEPGPVECLRGNHEQMMIDWFKEGDDLWLTNGGVATIESFGIVHSGDAALAEAVAWMEALPTWHEDKAHIYVHAGLRPRRPVGQQQDQDRLWIREGFLDVDYDFGKHVIHGHTPRLDGPERRSFRTNIDTGAVYGGALTAAILEDESSAPLGFLRIPA